jgi:hypothetical protein
MLCRRLKIRDAKEFKPLRMASFREGMKNRRTKAPDRRAIAGGK